tara:strand:+ start:247 stop:993 length:747 start_codon:yes stop_codon:yes gene_type:complete
MGLPTIAVPTYTLTVPSSGKEIKYRPFLVKEEKILLLAMESDNPTDMVVATKEIINNCTYGDFDANNSPVFDIEYIFLQLRGKAKGEIIDLKYKCPKCESEIPLSINIDQVKVIKNKEHTLDIKLKNDLGVMMKYPDIEMQTEFAKLNEEQSNIENMFESIIRCIDFIYDAETTYPAKDHSKQELLTFVESLTDEYFQKITQFFDTLPVLKHKTVLHCKNKVKGKGKESKVCNHKEDITLEGLASFFA